MEPARMSSSLEGFPEGQVQFDLERGAASVRVDSTLYPLEALYGAAYVFIDRAYVLLDRVDGAAYRVWISPKKPAGDDAIRALLGEFANELLSCAWRAQIAKDSRAIIEQATTRALGGARGAPSLDDLESFDFSDESFEDPLGIAMSGAEKYGKKKGAEGSDAKGASAAKPEAAAEAAKPEGESTP
jgi:His-Xaa-Ser system protein HxsD